MKDLLSNTNKQTITGGKIMKLHLRFIPGQYRQYEEHIGTHKLIFVTSEMENEVSVEITSDPDGLFKNYHGKVLRFQNKNEVQIHSDSFEHLLVGYS